MRTSIHTRLRFFSSYLLLTLSSPFPSSLLHLTHSPPCRRNRPLLLECPRMLPNKVCTPTLSIWIDGTPRPVVCSHPVALVSFPFLLQHLRSCFPSFTILPIPVLCAVQFFFFLIFFVAIGSLVCPLCHLLVLDRQCSCLVHPYRQVLIPIFLCSAELFSS